MLDLSHEHLRLIQRILAARLPAREVRVFGSRVRGRAKPTADLDLVVMGEERIPDLIQAELRADFDDSDLPFRVDLVTWSDAPPGLREIIGRESVLVQAPGAGHAAEICRRAREAQGEARVMSHSQKETPSPLPAELRPFFWDTDFARLDPVTHRRFIAERLMEKTTLDTFRWLLAQYPAEELQEIAERSRRLPARDRNFWRLYLAQA